MDYTSHSIDYQVDICRFIVGALLKPDITGKWLDALLLVYLSQLKSECLMVKVRVFTHRDPDPVGTWLLYLQNSGMVCSSSGRATAKRKEEKKEYSRLFQCCGTLPYIHNFLRGAVLSPRKLEIRNPIHPILVPYRLRLCLSHMAGSGALLAI